jgi:hypothetical protein
MSQLSHLNGLSKNNIQVSGIGRGTISLTMNIAKDDNLCQSLHMKENEANAHNLV